MEFSEKLRRESVKSFRIERIEHPREKLPIFSDIALIKWIDSV